MREDIKGVTHKVQIGGFKGFVTVNVTSDGDPFEVFIHDFGKLGSTMQGWADAFAIMLSIYIQAGGDVGRLAHRFARKSFEPYGKTDNPNIPWCDSLPDYVFRYLSLIYPDLNLEEIWSTA